MHLTYFGDRAIFITGLYQSPILRQFLCIYSNHIVYIQRNTPVLSYVASTISAHQLPTQTQDHYVSHSR